VKPNILVDFAMALGWLSAQWSQHGLGDFVLTSLNDSHTAGQHIHGQAADIRTRHLFADGKHKPELIEFARFLQKAGFRVVVHPEWVGGTPHLHVAWKQSFFEETD
jgi:hypothetical protein